MFQKTNSSGGTRSDWPLGIAVAAVVVVMLLLAVPLTGSMRMIYSFHRYVQELASSFVYGEEHDLLTLHDSDGNSIAVPKSRATRLYGKIVEKGMGHPQKEIPEGPYEDAVTLDFGNGTELYIRKVKILENGRKNDTGVLFRYTRENGTFFSYNTDGLQFEEIAADLGWGG